MNNYQKKSFQYRKRYGLHAIFTEDDFNVGAKGFNTASGMDCMQCTHYFKLTAEDRAFQYRKRYGLHAIRQEEESPEARHRFNTASGMDCMQ